MRAIDFNGGWKVMKDVPLFGFRQKPEEKDVTLPYDAMIHQEKRENTASTTRTGHFPEGEWLYKKTFMPDSAWKGQYVAVLFESVYMNASVYLNGERIAFHPYGYTEFETEIGPHIRWGEENTLKVACKTYQDSRWYTGAGLYRDCHLLVADQVRIPTNGIRAVTEHLEKGLAVVPAEVEVKNGSCERRTVRAVLTLTDPKGQFCGRETCLISAEPGKTEVFRVRFAVTDPCPWSPETPDLYHIAAVLTENGNEIDAAESDFGIRTVSVDTARGFVLNGETVNLRGGCIHHDNGVVGAATFSSMEERRIRILKKAGFNAVRMAHHPASRAMLRACDRVGMLLMDEFSDIWTVNKSKYDYSVYFDSYWESDITAMIRKNRCHPSVIMHSIGNEIPETGNPNGARISRMLAEKVRSLEPTVPVTNAINAMLCLGDFVERLSRQQGDVNAQMAQGHDFMKQIMELPEVAELTEEAYAALDIAGYNYMQDRYLRDHELYPNRVICGTEDFPKSIAGNWDMIRNCSWVIGDFTWTAWDYLGECGPWPSSLNTGGDIDAAGVRRTCSLYREIVFGLTEIPAIAVARAIPSVKTRFESMWGWTDTISGWSWNVPEGHVMEVEVYCPGDEAELFLNGKSLGRKAPDGEFAKVANFSVPYEAGTLTAVSYRGGAETGRSSLHSARGDVRLAACAEDTSMLEKPDELVFVQLSLEDEEGNLFHEEKRHIRVRAEGAGEVLGFGNADGKNPGGYDVLEQDTFEGRAFCVIRRTGKGTIRVEFTADGCAPCVIEC